MEVINMPGTKRLVVEIPESQHKAIKAKALLRGVSMREYVLEKLQGEDDCDMEDVTQSVLEALQEVGEHLGGEKEPRSARSFIAGLNK